MLIVDIKTIIRRTISIPLIYNQDVSSYLNFLALFFIYFNFIKLLFFFSKVNVNKKKNKIRKQENYEFLNNAFLCYGLNSFVNLYPSKNSSKRLGIYLFKFK